LRLNHFAFILFLGSCFGWIFTTQAQNCKHCPKSNSEADYCYKNALFPNQCARFSATSDFFYVYNQKRKILKLRVPESRTRYLLKIAQNKKLKLASSDILFLDKALYEWENRHFTAGFDTTSLGIGLKIMKQGKGTMAEEGKAIRFEYVGKFEDGYVFDSSLEQKIPHESILGQGKLIQGLDKGLVGLRVGTKAVLQIPPHLAYGNRSYGKIPAGVTLYYEVFILHVE